MANIVLRRRGVGDFVNAYFPEPNNPIYRPNWDPNPVDGMGDFVRAYFPEPNNPIYMSKGVGGMGCGCGCSGDCGMGAIAVPGFAQKWPAPLNDSVAGLPVVYWIGGIAAAAIVLPMVLGGGRRRR